MSAVIPRVHLNGTSKDELLKQSRDVYDALTTALAAMGRATPHGRDYYVISGEAITEAGVQHRARIAKIVEVLDELTEIHQGIFAQ